MCIKIKMVDWSYQREEAFKTIIASITNATNVKVKVDEEKLVNIVAVDYGFNKRRVEEYIETLVKAGKIIRKNGFLWAA